MYSSSMFWVLLLVTLKGTKGPVLSHSSLVVSWVSATMGSWSWCNSHYNHTPDLGNVWCGRDLWLSMGATDTRHEGTRLLMSLGWLSTRTLLDMSTRCKGTWLPLWVWTLTRSLGKRMIREENEASSDWRRPRWQSLVFELVLKYSSTLGLNHSLNCK